MFALEEILRVNVRVLKLRLDARQDETRDDSTGECFCNCPAYRFKRRSRGCDIVDKEYLHASGEP